MGDGPRLVAGTGHGDQLAGFAVIWRRGPGAPWEVQPRLHFQDVADILARRLIAAWGGEVVVSPLMVPREIE